MVATVATPAVEEPKENQERREDGWPETCQLPGATTRSPRGSNRSLGHATGISSGVYIGPGAPCQGSSEAGASAAVELRWRALPARRADDMPARPALGGDRSNRRVAELTIAAARLGHQGDHGAWSARCPS
jgi:hypothetical protein